MHLALSIRHLQRAHNSCVGIKKCRSIDGAELETSCASALTSAQAWNTAEGSLQQIECMLRKLKDSDFNTTEECNHETAQWDLYNITCPHVTAASSEEEQCAKALDMQRDGVEALVPSDTQWVESMYRTEAWFDSASNDASTQDSISALVVDCDVPELEIGGDHDGGEQTSVSPISDNLEIIEYQAFEHIGVGQGQIPGPWFWNQEKYMAGINFASQRHGVVLKDSIFRKFENMEWYMTYDARRACAVDIFGSATLGTLQSDEGWTLIASGEMDASAVGPHNLTNLVIHDADQQAQFWKVKYTRTTWDHGPLSGRWKIVGEAVELETGEDDQEATATTTTTTDGRVLLGCLDSKPRREPKWVSAGGGWTSLEDAAAACKARGAKYFEAECNQSPTPWASHKQTTGRFELFCLHMEEHELDSLARRDLCACFKDTCSAGCDGSERMDGPAWGGQWAGALYNTSAWA